MFGFLVGLRFSPTPKSLSQWQEWFAKNRKVVAIGSQGAIRSR